MSAATAITSTTPPLTQYYILTPSGLCFRVNVTHASIDTTIAQVIHLKQQLLPLPYYALDFIHNGKVLANSDTLTDVQYKPKAVSSSESDEPKADSSASTLKFIVAIWNDTLYKKLHSKLYYHLQRQSLQDSNRDVTALARGVAPKPTGSSAGGSGLRSGWNRTGSASSDSPHSRYTLDELLTFRTNDLPSSIASSATLSERAARLADSIRIARSNTAAQSGSAERNINYSDVDDALMMRLAASRRSRAHLDPLSTGLLSDTAAASSNKPSSDANTDTKASTDVKTAKYPYTMPSQLRNLKPERTIDITARYLPDITSHMNAAQLQAHSSLRSSKPPMRGAILLNSEHRRGGLPTMSSIHRFEDSTVDQQLLESLRRSREQLNAYKRDSMADIEQMNRAINAAKPDTTASAAAAFDFPAADLTRATSSTSGVSSLAPVFDNLSDLGAGDPFLEQKDFLIDSVDQAHGSSEDSEDDHLISIGHDGAEVMTDALGAVVAAEHEHLPSCEHDHSHHDDDSDDSDDDSHMHEEGESDDDGEGDHEFGHSDSDDEEVDEDIPEDPFRQVLAEQAAGGDGSADVDFDDTSAMPGGVPVLDMLEPLPLVPTSEAQPATLPDQPSNDQPPAASVSRSSSGASSILSPSRRSTSRNRRVRISDAGMVESSPKRQRTSRSAEQPAATVPASDSSEAASPPAAPVAESASSTSAAPPQLSISQRFHQIRQRLEAEGGDPLAFSINQDSLTDLTGMGFTATAAERALIKFRNHLQRAVNWLIEHSSEDGINDPVSNAEREELLTQNAGSSLTLATIIRSVLQEMNANETGPQRAEIITALLNELELDPEMLDVLQDELHEE